MITPFLSLKICQVQMSNADSRIMVSHRRHRWLLRRSVSTACLWRLSSYAGTAPLG